MRVAFLVFILVIASSIAVQQSNSFRDDSLGDIKKEFKDFVHRFHKNYTATEFLKRQAIYIKKKAEIIAHNLKYKEGKVGWNMTISRFTDMTLEEFRNSLGFKPRNHSRPAMMASSHLVKRYDDIDWRARGKMGPVKVISTSITSSDIV